MSTIIQLAGAVSITAGATLLSPIAGLIVGGVFLILIGLGYHQLRMVGWYWSRWYLDLGHLVAVPSGLENRCKQSC